MTKNGGSTNAPPRFLSVKELAELLRIKTRTIYEMVSQGRIPYRKVGDRTIFLLDEILEWTRPNAKREHAAIPQTGCDPQRGIDQCQFLKGVASGATTSGSTANVIAVRFQKPALRRKPNAPNTQFAIKCMKVLTVNRKLPLRCCGTSSPTHSCLGLRLTNEHGCMMSFAHVR